LYGGHGIEFLSVCLVNPERPSPFPNLDECENPLRGNYLAGIKVLFIFFSLNLSTIF